MAKLKNSKLPNKGSPSHKPIAHKRTILEIMEKHPEIWYKVKVLLYDLSSLKNDPASMPRLERTVDELYISEPYFTAEEAEMIKSALVPLEHCLGEYDYETEGEKVTFESGEEVVPAIDKAGTDSQTAGETTETEEIDARMKAKVEYETVEEAIQRRMVSFYDKRKASGDFQPCGPHDMVPVYLSVFGIEKGELIDDKFLRRVRRIELSESTLETSGEGRTKEGKGRGKGKGQKGQ